MPDAKLRSESIFDIEHLSTILRRLCRIFLDTLEQIFRFPGELGYGFDEVSPPRATDIRTGSPR
jgi:hypothetical protein